MTEVVSEWRLRVCEVCGRRAAPWCQLHPEALVMSIRVVPADAERFREDIGPMEDDEAGKERRP